MGKFMKFLRNNTLPPELSPKLHAYDFGKNSHFLSHLAHQIPKHSSRDFSQKTLVLFWLITHLIECTPGISTALKLYGQFARKYLAKHQVKDLVFDNFTCLRMAHTFMVHPAMNKPTP